MFRRSLHSLLRLPKPSMPHIRPDLENTLRLLPVAGKPDVFVNAEPAFIPPGARGVFGGTLVAQALWAAIRTVPETFVPHSLHSYFLRGGKRDLPIEYEVSRLRDGRSFVSREVKAYQDGELIFSEMISFSLERDERKQPQQLQHSKPFPSDVKFEDYYQPLESFKKGVVERGLIKKESLPAFKNYFDRFTYGPMDYLFPLNYWASVPGQDPHDLKPHEIDVNFFLKKKTPVRDPRFNFVALAYTTDSYLLLTVMRFHKRPLHSTVMSVSLDHSIYFHKMPKMDNWILYNIQHPKSGDSRNLLFGDMFDRDSGDLLATVVQEGLVVINDELLKSKL